MAYGGFRVWGGWPAPSQQLSHSIYLERAVSSSATTTNCCSHTCASVLPHFNPYLVVLVLSATTSTTKHKQQKTLAPPQAPAPAPAPAREAPAAAAGTRNALEKYRWQLLAICISANNYRTRSDVTVTTGPVGQWLPCAFLELASPCHFQ